MTIVSDSTTAAAAAAGAPPTPTPKPKLVLVTGGLGYIGSHVVVALLSTGRYLPVVYDSCANAYPEALARCARIARAELGCVPPFSSSSLPTRPSPALALCAPHSTQGAW